MENGEIILAGNGLELTEPLKAFAREKAQKLVRQENRILRIRIEVRMELNKGRERLFTARGIVRLQGPELVASESSNNAYAAIELMVDKLARMLRQRHRMRLFKRVRPAAIDLPAALPKVPVSRGNRAA